MAFYSNESERVANLNIFWNTFNLSSLDLQHFADIVLNLCITPIDGNLSN